MFLDDAVRIAGPLNQALPPNLSQPCSQRSEENRTEEVHGGVLMAGGDTPVPFDLAQLRITTFQPLGRARATRRKLQKDREARAGR